MTDQEIQEEIPGAQDNVPRGRQGMAGQGIRTPARTGRESEFAFYPASINRRLLPTIRRTEARTETHTGARTEVPGAHTEGPPMNELLSRLALVEEVMNDYRTSSLGGGRRETVYTEEATGGKPRRPKLKVPETFEGSYDVEYGVANWLISVEKYLQKYPGIETYEYSGYAYTYMGTTVKSWYDSTFEGRDPSWSELRDAMVGRYLPADHRLQVVQTFDGMTQTSTLLDYMEKFQKVLVAMKHACVDRAEEDKILRFIGGLRNEDDRKFLLEKGLSDMQEVYIVVNHLRQARILGRRQNKSDLRDYKKSHKFQKFGGALNKLEGAQRQKAFEKGLCLGCGKSGHWIADCTKTKKKLNSFQGGSKKGNQKPGILKRDGTKKNGPSKKARFHNLEKEEQDEDPEEAESGEEAEEGHEGNETPDSWEEES